MNEDLNNYKRIVRKFPVYKVLEYFSQQSFYIYANTKNGIMFEQIPCYYKKSGLLMNTYDFNIAQWDLLQVCFSSIKYGNDFRQKIISKNDYYSLLNETRIYYEKLENVEKFDNTDIFKHILCIANMEFDFQTHNTINKFNRIYHIMTAINENNLYDQTKKVNYINFRKEFFKITGIELDSYINCYMLLCLISLSTKKVNIMDTINSIDFDLLDFNFTKEDMINIVLMQSREYDFYKEHENWNVLKYYPIVHSQKYEDKYIISNISALFINLAECLYWIIRNYYCKLKSQNFVNYFGHCFEFYLNELFDTYFIKAHKIPEINNVKTPDWQLETDKYVFLIEQKAALYPIDTRSSTAHNRLKKLNKYLKDNILEAFIQLNNYQVKTNKPVIRICLMFENIYFTETIDDIILKDKVIEKNSHLNWIISINEFEKLVYLLYRNEAEFNEIIEKKIKLEKQKYNRGRGFEKLLNKYENDFIKNRINHFNKFTKTDLEILKKQHELIKNQ